MVWCVVGAVWPEMLSSTQFTATFDLALQKTYGNITVYTEVWVKSVQPKAGPLMPQFWPTSHPTSARFQWCFEGAKSQASPGVRLACSPAVEPPRLKKIHGGNDDQHGSSMRFWSALFWDKVPYWLTCFRDFNTTRSILIHVYVYNYMHSFRIRMSIYIYMLCLLFSWFPCFLLFYYSITLVISFLHFWWGWRWRERDHIPMGPRCWVDEALLLPGCVGHATWALKEFKVNHGAWHWAQENLQETPVSNMVKRCEKYGFRRFSTIWTNPLISIHALICNRSCLRTSVLQSKLSYLRKLCRMFFRFSDNQQTTAGMCGIPDKIGHGNTMKHLPFRSSIGLNEASDHVIRLIWMCFNSCSHKFGSNAGSLLIYYCRHSKLI